MKFDNLEQLYLSDLQDLYDAEKQLLKALPKLARQATAPKLAQGFERHARQTEEHAKRLEKIFRQHESKPTGRKCPAMAGLIAEANEVARERLSDELLDVGLITAAQKVEHYEISGYTSAIALARTLDLDSDIRLLERTLQEEQETEQKLSTLSEDVLEQQRNQQWEGQESEWEFQETGSKSRSRGRTSRSAAQRTGRRTQEGQRRSTRAGASRATRDHDEIRRWAEERGGSPASVRGTARRGEEAGLLRIDFPGYSGQQTLEQISWDEWFDKFDEMNLQFLYQDKTKDGRQSRFFKLVCEPRTAAATR